MAGTRAMIGIAAALALGLAATAALAEGAVSVEGNRFLRDGRPWVAEGVTLVGRVSPDREADEVPAYAAARARFGPGLLGEIRRYGADTVRYQVSQGGLDPRSPIHDPAYRDEVLEAVALARGAGFTVILSMQAHGPSGMHDASGRPSQGTRRAWRAILGEIGHDRGVMLELYNEPGPRDRNAKSWAIWQADAQGLIDFVRGRGASNVLLVDGMRAGHYLGGSPRLHDPAGQLGYAVHPYLVRINRTRAQWDKNFGDFARDHPVMATEFNARSANGYCRESFPEEVDQLLDYLRARHIGLVVWAFDLPGVRRRDGTLTDYDDFACGPKGNGGAGTAVHEHFLAH
jgi:hypothetical protein